MATNLLSLFGHIQEQGDLGRAEGRRMRLADLASQAYGAPSQQRSGLVQQAIGVDPQAGFALGQQLHGDEDQRMQRVGQMAGMLISAPPEARAQLWSSQIVPEMQRIGFGEGLSPQWSEEYLPMAQQIAQQLGGGGSVPSGYQEFDMLARDANLSPEDRALAARRALYLDRRPSNAAIKYEGIEGDDGRTRQFALDPNSPNAQQIGGDQFGFLGSLGAQVTSGQRSRQDNARVGGVPNSYHLSGQARDILPPTNPQQAAAIRQQAAANGLEVIDEGDHWHLEPRPGRARGGVNPFVGRRPEDEAAAVEAAKTGVQLQALPTELGMRTDAAIAQATGTERAKADLQRQEAEPARQEKVRQVLAKTANLTRTIDDAIERVGVMTAGFVGSMMDEIPGSSANDLRVIVNTIKANLAFDALQAMREASPTGGALGAVSERELGLLESAVASLDQSQTPEQLRQALQRVKQHYNAWEQAVMQADQSARARVGGNSAPAGGGVDDLLQKYGIN